ncbi:DUF6445 family protein [Sphingomonas sp. A2-49]|uniref:DUF6445 family protein n=1 Tax=Sphingomonas sp. A2-49 TaxID=1391375 RepID=UPI0021D0F1F2|nr:DUF6445 family protein [Sphingomonas sp. A2-49]MCU6454537.1 DUF6445 family protein [Sphingomonas sp. A2-49]
MTRPDVRARRIGQEREPVVVIDHFALDPDALRAFAATRPFGPAGQHYPGIKAPLPPDYLRAQGRLIAAVARDAFGITGPISVLEARFSIVTLTPDALSLEQRLPHVDALEPGQLALIHYLVPAGTGGTAFYRHRSTGYETVDGPRSAPYFDALKRDLARQGAPEGYIDGDTPLFERIAALDGVYNRALLYRGHMLHSGVIAADAAPSPDPVAGRLTVTGFFAT